MEHSIREVIHSGSVLVKHLMKLRVGVRSAMCAASQLPGREPQLPGREPTDVVDAPAPAR